MSVLTAFRVPPCFVAVMHIISTVIVDQILVAVDHREQCNMRCASDRYRANSALSSRLLRLGFDSPLRHFIPHNQCNAHSPLAMITFCLCCDALSIRCMMDVGASQHRRERLLQHLLQICAQIPSSPSCNEWTERPLRLRLDLRQSEGRQDPAQHKQNVIIANGE